MIEPLLWLLGFFVLLLFILALFYPAKGIYWRWRRDQKITERVLLEDALKHIHRYERYGRAPSLESLAGATGVNVNKAAVIVAELESLQFIQFEGENFRLTSQGLEYALHILRAHRIWERYLADETGFAQERWHDQAEMAEHQLTPAEVDDLSADLGHPTHDPHGDPIPTSLGNLVPHGGQPLSTMPFDTPARIVHLEDEPEAIYAQLVAEELVPGMIVSLVEMTPQRVRFWANGDIHVLAPIVAGNISVIPLLEEADEQVQSGQRLSSLKPGQKGEVLAISRVIRGNERRRFLDLGILPGTEITSEMTSPSGDPTAYRIRDALIALRSEQAQHIRVRPLEDGD